MSNYTSLPNDIRSVFKALMRKKGILKVKWTCKKEGSQPYYNLRRAKVFIIEEWETFLLVETRKAWAVVTG